MKKMLSVIASLSMLLAMMSSTAVSAESADYRQEKYYAVLVTDGSYLHKSDVEEMLHGEEITRFSDVTNTEFLRTADESFYYFDYEPEILPQGSFSTVEAAKEYDGNARMYSFFCNEVIGYQYQTSYAEMYADLRRLIKENDSIVDVRLIRFQDMQQKGGGFLADSSLNLIYGFWVNGPSFMSKEEIMQIPLIQLIKEKHDTFYDTYYAVQNQLCEENAEVTKQLVDERLVAAGSCTFDEYVEERYALQTTLTGAYTLQIAFSAGGFDTSMSAKDSLWENFGDVNKDGGITANDAADILIYCAKAGTGYHEPTLDREMTINGDINADGILDASDAANILAYSSAHGIGLDVDIRDYIQ